MIVCVVVSARGCFAGAMRSYEALQKRNPSRFPDGGAVVQYRLDETTIDLVVRAAASAKAAPLAPAAVAPAVGPPVPPPRAVPPVAPAAPAPLPAAAAPSPIAQAAAAGRRASLRVRAPVLPVLPVLPPPAPPPATTPAAARVFTKRKSKASVRRESNTANMNHLELLAWFVNDGGYGLVHLSQLTAAMSHLKATNEKLVDEARAKLTGIKHAIDPGTDAIGVCRCLLVT